MDLWSALGAVPLVLAAVGVAYHAYAAWAVRRFFAGPHAHPEAPLPVSLIKPLHGAEPRLTDNLATFLAQDYAAPVQMVCGTNTADDSAVAPARAVIAAHPAADIALFTGPRLPGANGKMGNCAAMLPLARHDVLILSDSDMVVAPDYLARVTTALAVPGTGAVTCLYLGRGDTGWWSWLGAAMIDWQTMPNMIVGLATGLARPCMGSTIALRRETLEAIGGFASLTEVLADDHAIGAGVSALGLAVSVPPILLIHAGAEANLPALWRQHLRWAVTVRSLAGAGHLGSVVTHALPLAIIGMIAHPLAGAALALAAMAARLAVTREVARAAKAVPGRIEPPRLWLPLADMLAFAVFCCSLVAQRIDWRGSGLTMARFSDTGAPVTAGRIRAHDKRD